MIEAFVEELRLEYERRERASESLAKKTKDLMVVSGIIATLIMGFYSSFAQPLESQIVDWHYLPLGSVLLMLLTVIFCIWSNRAESQQTILIGKNLTKDSKTNFNIVKSWIKAKKEDYYEAIIDEYVTCLKKTEDAIEYKAKLLTISIVTFMAGLGIFPVFLIMTLSAGIKA